MGLTAEFHENFRRKAFFDQPWKPRKESGWKSSRRKSPRGTLLVATGKLRRSLKAQTTASGVLFTSAMPYVSMHNEGFSGEVTVPQHTRKATTAIRISSSDIKAITLPVAICTGRVMMQEGQ